jgi:hypothetical protein
MTVSQVKKYGPVQAGKHWNMEAVFCQEIFLDFSR